MASTVQPPHFSLPQVMAHRLHIRPEGLAFGLEGMEDAERGADLLRIECSTAQGCAVKG